MNARPPTGADAVRLSQVVTIELAWSLHQARIRVVDALLEEVRDHVLLSLPEGLGLAELGPCTRRLVADYLERVLERCYRGPQPEQEGLPSVDEGWRHAIEAACDPLSLAVLRLRYGDGLSPGEVARHCGLDSSSLQAVLEGLRELMRAEAQARLGSLTPGVAWVDALLARVVTAAGDSCPDARVLVGIARGDDAVSRGAQRHHQHADSCPHCARGVRLLRAGILRPEHLEPPAGSLRPDDAAQLLAIHLHPHARQHQKSLAAALGRVLLVGEDSLLVDVGRAPGWKDVLAQRARMGLPSRDQMRGALYQGPGRWTSRVVLGPAPVAALDLSRARPWGEVDDIPALPEPMPPPPSVARWWTGAVAVGTIAVLVGSWVLLEREDGAAFPLSTTVTDGGGAIVARFDVDDRAYVNAYTIGVAGMKAELESRSAADKVSLATGEGDFELVTLDRGVVIVSSPAPIDDLDQIWGSGELLVGGSELIRERILAKHPDSDVAVFWGGD
jgi:hypothetical protein